MTRDNKLRRLIYALASGELLFFMVSYLGHKYWPDLAFPKLDFMFNAIDRYADFYSLFWFTKGLDPYKMGSSYPPFGLVLFLPFRAVMNVVHNSWIWSEPVLRHVGYLPLVAVFVIPLAWLFRRELKTGDVAFDVLGFFALAFSVPVVMVIERGNTMFLPFFMVYAALMLLRRSKHMPAAVMLGLATAARIYPAVFLWLLLREKRFKEVGVAIATAVGASAVSLFAFRGGFTTNLARFVKNLLQFQKGAEATGAYRSDVFSLHFTSSMKALFQIPVMLLNNGVVPRGVPMNKVYLLFQVLVLAGVILYSIWEPVEWKRVFLLAAVIVMLPAVTYEHNLLYYLLPLFLWANTRESDGPRWDGWMALLFALLFIPKNYYTLFFDPPYYPITINALINPALVLGTLVAYFVANAGRTAEGIATAFSRLAVGRKVRLPHRPLRLGLAGGAVALGVSFAVPFAFALARPVHLPAPATNPDALVKGPAISAPATGTLLGVTSPTAPLGDVNGETAGFEGVQGKGIGMVAWTQEWSKKSAWRFDGAKAYAVLRSGRVPLITWEPWASADPSGAVQTQFSLSSIASGEHDGYIRRFAHDAAAIGGPIMLRPMPEVNGAPEHPWSAQAPGNSAELYVKAWRHMHDLFKEEGATNVTWVWGIAAEDASGTGTPAYAAYYPGDDYVDWTSARGINWGDEPGQRWRAYPEIFDAHLAYLRTLRKPIIVQLASVETGGDKPAWLRVAYRHIARDTSIKAAVYENLYGARVFGPQDRRVATSEKSVTAFKRAVRPKWFITGPNATLARWNRVINASPARRKALEALVPIY